MKLAKLRRKLFVISAVATFLLGFIVTFPAMAYPFNPSDTEIGKALNYLKDLQHLDGSIGDFGTSAWATMAIAAAGKDPHTWTQGDVSIVDYLKASTDQLNLSKASDVERFILSMTAAKEDPRNISGTDYVAILQKLFIDGQIGDGEWLFDDFWGIIALISAGTAANSTIIQDTAQFIRANQNADGGWGWAVGVGSDVDNTAAAIMALLASGGRHGSFLIEKGLDFLRENQQSDGGFPSWGITNSASDSWAICSLIVAGQDPTSISWTKNGNNPISHLLSLQNPDGSFNWTSTDPDWVNKALMTSYAIVALCGKTYPVNGLQIYVRIEGSIETVWSKQVFVAASLIKDDKGQEHYLTNATVLGALDKAAEVGGFNYMVEKTAYGLYVYSVAGEAAAGTKGWMYRVNYVMPWVGAGDFVLGETSPPQPPHDEVLWYYGEWTDAPIKIQVGKTEMKRGEKFTVMVSYYNDTTADWSALDSATVKLDDYTYTTNSGGTVTINTLDIAPGVYMISANKTGFIRSDKTEVTIYPKPKPLPKPSRNKKPIADFTYSPDHPTDLDTVEFADKSYDPDGSIRSWYWEFGDGLNSTERSPAHKYADDGNYTVTLTVTDDEDARGETVKEITVLNVPPKAGFTFESTHQDTIQFTDLSSDPDGSIVSWHWDFGDGTTSTDQNPTHRYEMLGTSTVKLTVTDDNGATDTASKICDALPPSTINDYDDLWHVEDFIVTLTASDDYSGVQATYYRINDGPIKTLPGDGQPYITIEGYNKLEYWSVDEAGNEETHHIIDIKLDKTAPVADAGGDDTVAENTAVSFDASGSSDNVGVVSYEWSFGDGSTGAGLTITHIYAELGTYVITLTLKDAAGNEDADSILITVLKDTDRDGTPDEMDMDDDGDGMPDAWEIKSKLDPLDAIDALLDPDRDGLTNLEEHRRGTDPHNYFSPFPPWTVALVVAFVLILGIIIVYAKRH